MSAQVSFLLGACGAVGFCTHGLSFVRVFLRDFHRMQSLQRCALCKGVIIACHAQDDVLSISLQ